MGGARACAICRHAARPGRPLAGLPAQPGAQPAADQGRHLLCLRGHRRLAGAADRGRAVQRGACAAPGRLQRVCGRQRRALLAPLAGGARAPRGPRQHQGGGQEDSAGPACDVARHALGLLRRRQADGGQPSGDPALRAGQVHLHAAHRLRPVGALQHCSLQVDPPGFAHPGWQHAGHCLGHLPQPVVREQRARGLGLPSRSGGGGGGRRAGERGRQRVSRCSHKPPTNVRAAKSALATAGATPFHDPTKPDAIHARCAATPAAPFKLPEMKCCARDTFMPNSEVSDHHFPCPARFCIPAAACIWAAC